MKAFLIAASVLLLAACGQEQAHHSVTTDDLQGRWVISGVTQSEALTQHVPWVIFENNAISGYAGCNNFMGNYQLDKQTLVFEQLASTRMLCAGPEMQQEDALLQLLNQALHVQKEQQKLLLTIDGKTVLSLTKDEK